MKDVSGKTKSKGLAGLERGGVGGAGGGGWGGGGGGGGGGVESVGAGVGE